MSKRPDWYMFEQHSRQKIAGWARQLHYFYFCRAQGGHANDGDTFMAGIIFSDKVDLLHKLSLLNIRPGTIGPDDLQPVAGQAYTGDEFAKFKTPVTDFPGIEQPGHVCITGQKAFIWISQRMITFSVSGIDDGNLYEVSDADFKACLALEAVFDNLNWQAYKDTSAMQSSSCVSPASYPEFY